MIKFEIDAFLPGMLFERDYNLIREFDNEISIILTKKIIERFENGKLKGKRQEGKESFYFRRKPEDNEIDSNSRILDVFNHLKACEKSHPAFFYYHQYGESTKQHPWVRRASQSRPVRSMHVG